VPRLIPATLLAVPTVAHAHVVDPAGMETWVAVSLAVSAIAYVVGLRKLWQRAGVGHGVSARKAAMFAAGWLTLAAALGGPIEAWSGTSFAAHMLQHELMMLAAAPLLAASRPLGVFAWALPANARRRLRALTSPRWLQTAWQFITAPLWATALSIVVLWVWHVPALFDLATVHRGWHALQHASFFVTALAFWWALRAGGTPAHRIGQTVACLFVTMVVTGALGGLLAFSTAPWYSSYAHHAAPFGWTPLEDQQMGGLIMWIPGGALYMIVALLRMRDALVGLRSGSIRRPIRGGMS
jgi:putative membrane protein